MSKNSVWSVDYQENHENYFHQMSHFKAQMHQSRFLAAVCLFGV